MNGQNKNILLLGDSHVRCRWGFDWVGPLKRQFSEFSFDQQGQDGALAYNALENYRQLPGRNYDACIIFVGTNDANATMSEKNSNRYLSSNRLPEKPTLQTFRKYLGELLNLVVSNGKETKIAVCSVPLLSEIVDSKAFQTAVGFSNAACELSQEYRAAFLPIIDLVMGILAKPTDKSPLPYHDGLRDPIIAAIYKYLFFRSCDQVARMRGLRVSVDNIHMNSASGTIVQNQIADFLTKNL